ncbi:MAG: RNA-binding domain-containing protein [Thermoplasmata archaeon]
MAESLQELIARGRFTFSGAPRRFEVFKLVNGRRTAKEIAKRVGRSQSSISNDIAMLRDFGLVIEKTDSQGNPVKKAGSQLYEKTPLAKRIPKSYFRGTADTRPLAKQRASAKRKGGKISSIRVPDEQEILDICRDLETQLYEFKGPGTQSAKIAREVAALLHSKRGGIILYGVDEDGTIIGADLSVQDFDQRVQNSVRNTINPSPTIQVVKRTVLGSDIILVVVPPWDRKTLYQYRDQLYLIRKGTNVFALKPGEIKKLNRGKYIV